VPIEHTPTLMQTGLVMPHYSSLT